MASTVELMRSTLKQREGEVAALRQQLRSVEATRGTFTTQQALA